MEHGLLQHGAVARPGNAWDRDSTHGFEPIRVAQEKQTPVESPSKCSGFTKKAAPRRSPVLGAYVSSGSKAAGDSRYGLPWDRCTGTHAHGGIAGVSRGGYLHFRSGREDGKLSIFLVLPAGWPIRRVWPSVGRKRGQACHGEQSVNNLAIVVARLLVLFTRAL